VLLVALAVLGAGCSSKSDGSSETGGASGFGGSSSTGGSTSSGGSGADEGTGGTAGSGGAQPSGGAQSTGGTTGGTGGSATGGTGGGTTGGSGGSAAGGSGDSATGGSTTGGSTTGGSGGSATGGELPAGGRATGGSTGGVGTGGASAGDGGTQSGEVTARTIEANGYTFDALEIGPASGEPVLLLHGFPDTSLEWTALMPVLSDSGYHCLAPDQRGYSPGARPTEVDAYAYEELVADAFAFGSELGDRFHVVAHDWGANVGWLMLQKDPSKIASFTAISIPHYGVWARSVYDDPEMSSYLRMLNTWMTPGDGEAFWTEQAMRNMWSAKPADLTEATIAHMMEPGAMTAALNWYRASDGHKSVIEDYELWEVNVPTLLIHGSTDVGERSVTETEPLMKGPYRVVRPEGGHFIVDEQPEVVAAETLAHLQAYPIQ
jgi:pimeloyl-ACP methyl ester carboxylesterase